MMGPRPVHVAHFIGSLGMGGAERVVSTLIGESSRERCRYTVFAFEGGALAESFVHEGVDICIRPLRSWAVFPLWIGAVARELRARRVDVVHTHLFATDIAGRLAGRLAGAPVVVSTLHAPSSWKRSDAPWQRMRKALDRWSANALADRLIAISSEVAAFQADCGGLDRRKMVIIGNPVRIPAKRETDPDRASLRAKLGVCPAEFAVMSVGSLKPIKGHRYALEALALLGERGVSCQWLFVGDGISRGDLLGLASSLGVDSRAVFLGARSDAADLLAAADAVAMPSLSEGISIAILEAMAARVPVVATAVGGNPELVRHGETGLLVAPRDPVALADSIQRLAFDAPLRERLAEAAFGFVVERYEANRIVDAVEGLYLELLAGASGLKGAR